HASQTIAGYWLPRHLAAFRHAWPGIDVRVRIGNTREVAACVHDGRADLGFVEGPVADPALTATRVAGDRLVIVVAPSHAWAAPGARIRPAAL
ncbi:LysR substrate-binding domain-containing protein, partial [Acidisphaera rubrifaciens]|uniref:LysR substrate-binding domain-containing protein n=1 Tax=Acidisphaera rubrifaciens TaxID=50715 RepID=UPI0006624627